MIKTFFSDREKYRYIFKIRITFSRIKKRVRPLKYRTRFFVCKKSLNFEGFELHVVLFLKFFRHMDINSFGDAAVHMAQAPCNLVIREPLGIHNIGRRCVP